MGSNNAKQSIYDMPTDNWGAVEVIPRLYLGSAFAADNKYMLNMNGITHIVAIAKEVDPKWTKHYTYLKIDADDNKSVNIIFLLPTVIQFIDEVLESPSGCVMVHCLAGVSRSASLVTGYIMKKQSKSYKEALDLIKLKRPFVNPNNGFEEQLRLYEQLAYDISKLPSEHAYLSTTTRPDAYMWKKGKKCVLKLV